MTTNVPFNLVHTGNNDADDVNLVFISNTNDNKFNIGYDKGDDLFAIARNNSLDTGKIVTINSPDNYTGDIVLKVETNGINGSVNNLVTITSNQNNSVKYIDRNELKTKIFFHSSILALIALPHSLKTSASEPK